MLSYLLLRMIFPLYVSGKTKSGDLTNFFHHENQAYPPCIIDNGLVCLGKRPICPYVHSKNQTVLDGAAVQMSQQNFCRLCWNSICTICYSISFSVSSVLQKQFGNCYIVNRGTGGCRHVVAVPALPLNWLEFLRVDSKTQLFSFFSKFVIEITHDTAKQLSATDVTSATPFPADSLIMPCSHEEEDTCMCCIYFMLLNKAFLRQWCEV
jgi:hypothetical protein